MYSFGVIKALGFMFLGSILMTWFACQQQANSGEKMQFLEASIPELQAALDEGVVTSEDLVEMYLDRITAYDQQGPSLNAISVTNPDAMENAQALDAERKTSGARSPLHGIPVVVKDNYETVGMQTAGGSASLAGWIPPHDAFLVKRLREAGAIILAKTNMHEFAMGVTTLGSLFGQTRNPYHLDRNPGGSSGGTGAAVAASFAAVGMGSDTCGSIRIPASHNSLVGIRGTQGLASRAGIIPLSHTQDIGGPLGRSVVDVAIVLDAIVGYDPADPETAESVGNIPESYTTFLREEGLRGARIGLLTNLLSKAPEDEQVARVIRRAMSEMEHQGATVIEVAIPGLDELMLDRDGGFLVLTYEFREDLNNYLDQHPGAPVRSLKEIVQSGKYHPKIASRLHERQNSLPTETPEYSEILLKRVVLKRAVLQLMAENDLDVLAYPTIRQIAVPLGEDQEGSNCHLSANSGLPSITVPAGFVEEGLPVGLEFLGRAWSEGLLIELAYAYEQFFHHRLSPGSTPPLRDHE